MTKHLGKIFIFGRKYHGSNKSIHTYIAKSQINFVEKTKKSFQTGFESSICYDHNQCSSLSVLSEQKCT